MARGTIRKRVRKSGVSYEVRIPEGKDPLTGKQREWNKSFRTKKEAEAARIARLAEMSHGTAVDPSRLTVAEVMHHWLDTHARHSVSAKTLDLYERIIRLHIVPSLGPIRVQKLTADQLQTFYSDKLADGCGRRTIELCHLRISQALKQAVKLGLVARNVADAVTPPRIVPKEMQTWSPEQARRFLAAAQQSNYGPIWMLYLATGLRRGELLGLRWQDVDPQRRVLHIEQTVISVAGKPMIKPPKSRASRRSVALQPEVVAALKEHQLRQYERRLALGPAWEDNGLVFPANNGKPIHPDNLRRDFHHWIAQAGVPRIRIHDLRHTHVTMALASGSKLRAVSERVGHARPSITMNVYAHVLPEQHVEVADNVGQLLFGRPPHEAL